jgi:hypothetical protein
MGNARMVCYIDEFRFEKFPNSSTVTIYVDDKEIECFTNYNIGTDFDEFENSCENYYKYMFDSEE